METNNVKMVIKISSKGKRLLTIEDIERRFYKRMSILKFQYIL